MESTTSSTKQRRPRLVSNNEFLKKLIANLSKEILTKDQLAEKLELSDSKRITDSVLLAAIRLEGNAIFLENLIEKTTSGRVKKGPQYSPKRGLVVPAYMIQDKGIAPDQKYTMSYGVRTGIIKLTPTDE